MNSSQNNNLFTKIHQRITNSDAPLFFLPDGVIITYGDMERRSAQFANALVSLGVVPGDRVAAQVEKSVEAIFVYLGCIRAGAVYLPLNTGYRDKELEYFVQDAGPRVVICLAERRAAVETIIASCGGGRVETLSEDGGGTIASLADTMETQFREVHRDDDDLAAILYTSGTTGRSKGAMLTHRNLGSNAEVLVKTWRFTASDVLLHALPIYHTHGLFVATNITLLAGSSMFFLPRFEPDTVLEALPKATTMMGVPTFYTRLLGTDDFTDELVSHMRLFVSGSAPLSPETHKTFEKRTGHVLLERYGMTETSMNTSNPYDGDRLAGTVGFPLDGIEIRIADQKTGEPVRQGEVGVIEIRGPNVFKGYWQNPEKTAEEFRHDGFFISGDLGLIDDRGYVSIVGRTKDLIITGGFNVYPAEVENALDALDGIAESAVIGVPHPDFGEGVTAIVTAQAGKTPMADEIRAGLSQDLAKYKLPKQVIVVDALPRNKMGKVQKNQLRDTYRDIYL